MKTKKFTAALLCAALLCLPLKASAELHWYFCPTKDHTQPQLPSEFSFIEELGGVYLDRSHGDEAEEKVIYLTFDVGYENGNVSKILDTLKSHGAVGTFFILEHVLRDNTNLVKRMFDEGHTVANHTMTHKNMANADRSVLESELSGLASLCKELTGHEMPKLYRPPEGSFSCENMEALHEMGYHTVFWSCAYADWDNSKQPSPDAAMDKLTSRLHNGEILLLHPTSSTNAAIMDRLLSELESRGYRFASVEELCGK